MKKAFINKNFQASSMLIIQRADRILSDMHRKGFNLTVRQLYYQFVARDWIENTERSYKRVVNIISDARWAGYIDWNHIKDRTRELERVSTWGSPSDIIASAASSYKEDLWNDQNYRPEVWVEKEALADVIEQAAHPFYVPTFSCRGYASSTSMYDAGQRIRYNARTLNQQPVVLYLGDHDPSGLDMTRDIVERLTTLSGGVNIEFHALALNMEQIQEMDLPPNPAKLSDSRAPEYVEQYGTDSWELDALQPEYLVALIQEKIKTYIKPDLWRSAQAQEDANKSLLNDCSENWGDVAEFIEGI